MCVYISLYTYIYTYIYIYIYIYIYSHISINYRNSQEPACREGEHVLHITTIQLTFTTKLTFENVYSGCIYSGYPYMSIYLCIYTPTHIYADFRERLPVLAPSAATR